MNFHADDGFGEHVCRPPFSRYDDPCPYRKNKKLNGLDRIKKQIKLFFSDSRKSREWLEVYEISGPWTPIKGLQCLGRWLKDQGEWIDHKIYNYPKL